MTTSPLLLGLPGTELTTTDRERLDEIRPWGVILFARNYESVPQIKRLIRDVKNLLGHNTAIAIDHEGGRVVRFPEALPKLPAPRLLGEQRDPEKVRALSRESGEALRDWGFTINLAPVVDILMDGSHPRMIDRCFGKDAQLVSEMAIAFIEGMHDAGLQCTAKHFPGIGPATDDTHDKGTIVSLSREQLQQLWQPFRKVIAAGVDAVMVTHATYTALDPDAPATLSSKIIRGILREELGFTRMIISDDLEMGAIANTYSIEGATKQCLAAGCDIASLCLDTDGQLRAYRNLQ